MSKFNFAGRVAIVTGAGTGLGREYAILLASRGAQVIVNDLGTNRNGEGKSNQADCVVDAIRDQGGSAIASYDSVTEGNKIVKTALDNYGRLDILINNAGILRDKSFLRISEQDWDLIQDVHLKGSFLTTQAAWPIFKKQQFGRIIMTSSSSGVCGNFGQTNYSAAKLGLIGMSNTLAIEGAKYNIHCNVIVPTATSRMTQDILPDDLLKGLDPKHIAPVVAYLCHESNQENGTIIESSAGWASKYHFVRSLGCTIRASITDDVTIEKVNDAWTQITDLSQSVPIGSFTNVSSNLLHILNRLKQTADTNPNTITERFTFNRKDATIYALGIGATVNQFADLRYVYENHQHFRPLPTFFVLPSLKIASNMQLFQSALSHTNLNVKDFLLAEHYLEIFRDPPTDGGNFTTKMYVIDVMDKDTGAVVAVNCDTYDENGTLFVRNQIQTFIKGAGKFNGKSNPTKDIVTIVATPARAPDATISLKTSIDQAAIYRLSGDFNAMHIDPDVSRTAGQPIPILQGLCTLGFSMRAILSTYANNDATKFKSIKARFVKPVIPGQTLKIDMWKNERRIHFRTSVVETGAEVITGAYMDLKPCEAITNESIQLQCDKIFPKILQRFAGKEHDAIRQINGIFQFNITMNGQIASIWIVDMNNANIYRGQSGVDAKADAYLTISDDLMVNLINGRVDVQVAFLKGDIKIKGNVMLTQQLLPIIKNLQ